jgi:hypothetical protein
MVFDRPSEPMFLETEPSHMFIDDDTPAYSQDISTGCCIRTTMRSSTMFKKREHVFTHVASLGLVELRHLSVGDSLEIMDLQKTRDLPDREFVLKVLHRQLLAPTLTIVKFRKTSDNELKDMAEALMSGNISLCQYYSDTGHTLADIRAAFAIYHHKFQEDMANLQSAAADALANFTRTLKASLDGILKESKIQENKAAGVLRKYKWFICPSMPASAIRTILMVAKKRGRKDADVNRLFIDYFSSDSWSNLESMVAAWRKNPLFKTRMPILSNCVRTMQAADREGFNGALVVLPAIISQIDGFLTDYLIRKGIPYKAMYDDFVQNGKVKKIGRKTQFRANAPNALTAELNDLALDMCLNILFQTSQRGKPLATPFNFNRHKIMHGESVRFGRKDYAVRAFMVLDFMAHLK